MAHSYLSWDKKTISDFSPENINSLYNQGFVFVRTGRGMMEQTRSLRIDLAKFKLSSENKRILKKTEGLELEATPLSYSEYHWSIGKLAKDFYTKKFGDGTFSANKVKELLTEENKSNFNVLLQYVISSEMNEVNEVERSPSNLDNQGDSSTPLRSARNDRISNVILSEARRAQSKDPLLNIAGYSICHETNDILHYCYPFYNPESTIPNLGMGMMLRAIIYAQEKDKKYIYLGSFQRPTDVYKLQFEGLEWWDAKQWLTDLNELKLTRIS